MKEDCSCLCNNWQPPGHCKRQLLGPNGKQRLVRPPAPVRFPLVPLEVGSMAGRGWHSFCVPASPWACFLKHSHSPYSDRLAIPRNENNSLCKYLPGCGLTRRMIFYIILLHCDECFYTKIYPENRTAKLKSNPDGFSDLLLHQHFLYVLGNGWREFYIHSRFNTGTWKAMRAAIKLELSGQL